MKCYRAAADSFAELVDRLAGVGPTPVPQDLTRRTYHARTAGPPRGGLLSWREPAEALDAAVRACDFGPKRNTFGSIKLAVADGFALVRGARLAAASSTEPPGTVVAVTDDAVTVSTVTRDIQLRLSTMVGRSFGVRDLAARWGIRLGHRFAEPGPERVAAVTEACRSASRHEEFWVERLARLAPMRPPRRATWMAEAETAAATAPRRRYDFPAPGATSATVLGAVLAYLAMVSGAQTTEQEPADVGLRWRAEPDPDSDPNSDSDPGPDAARDRDRLFAGTCRCGCRPWPSGTTSPATPRR